MMLRREPVRVLAFSRWRRRAVSRPTIDHRPLARGLAVVGQQGQQAGEIRAVPVAVDPGLGEADIATFQNASKTDQSATSSVAAIAAPPGRSAVAIRRAGEFPGSVFDSFQQRQYAPALRGCGLPPGEGRVSVDSMLFIASSPQVEVQVC
jgi:hypothetical protein